VANFEAAAGENAVVDSPCDTAIDNPTAQQAIQCELLSRAAVAALTGRRPQDVKFRNSAVPEAKARALPGRRPHAAANPQLKTPAHREDQVSADVSPAPSTRHGPPAPGVSAPPARSCCTRCSSSPAGDRGGHRAQPGRRQAVVDYQAYRVGFSDTKGVVPGRAELRLAGVKAGSIKKSELVNGKAVLTVNLEKRYAPLYRDARVRIRPVTPLEDMYVDIESRGPKSAGVLTGERHPGAQHTISPVEIGTVLDQLDKARGRTWRRCSTSSAPA